MKITKQLRTRILLQTVFFAAVFLSIGIAIGYRLAAQEAAAKILTELSK